MKIPRGLHAALVAAGRIDPPGATRALAAFTCRTCRTPVGRGLDADTCALTVTVDLDDLHPVGELLAVAAGRTTYDVVHGKGRLELEIRRPAHINQPRRYSVVAEHKCGNPLPVNPVIAAEPKGAGNAPPF